MESVKNLENVEETSLTPESTEPPSIERFQIPKTGKSSPKWSSIYLGISFLFLFAPFDVIQAFTTTLLGQGPGFLSLALIYGFFTISSLFSPVVITVAPLKGDARWSMFVGAIPYVLWMVSVATAQMPFVLVASALIGLGAGLLWVGQSIYLDSLSSCQRFLEALGEDVKRPRGDVSGYIGSLFYSFFSFAQIVGNVIVLIVLTVGVSVNWMVWGMACMGAIGVILLCFANGRYRESLSPSKSQVEKVKTNFSNQVKSRMTDLGCVIKSKIGLRLLTLFVLQGAAPAWSFGVFPILIPKVGVPLEKVPWTLALLFLIYGVACTCASAIVGKVYRIFAGWKYIFVCIVSLQTLAYLLMILLTQGVFTNGIPSSASAVVWSILVICSILHGILDAELMAMSQNVITTVTSHSSTNATPYFSLYRASAALSFAIISVIASFVPYWIVAIIEWCLGIIMVSSVWSVMTKTDEDELERVKAFEDLVSIETM